MSRAFTLHEQNFITNTIHGLQSEGVPREHAEKLAQRFLDTTKASYPNWFASPTEIALEGIRDIVWAKGSLEDAKRIREHLKNLGVPELALDRFYAR